MYKCLRAQGEGLSNAGVRRTSLRLASYAVSEGVGYPTSPRLMCGTLKPCIGICKSWRSLTYFMHSCETFSLGQSISVIALVDATIGAHVCDITQLRLLSDPLTPTLRSNASGRLTEPRVHNSSAGPTHLQQGDYTGDTSQTHEAGSLDLRGGTSVSSGRGSSRRHLRGRGRGWSVTSTTVAASSSGSAGLSIRTRGGIV